MALDTPVEEYGTADEEQTSMMTVIFTILCDDEADIGRVGHRLRGPPGGEPALRCRLDLRPLFSFFTLHTQTPQPKRPLCRKESVCD